MKLKALVAALIATSGLMSMSAAQASDGTITFTGSIVATTCTVNGGGAASSFTVALPPVDKAALSAAGQTSSPTPMTFNLTTCPAGQVHTLFEIGSSVDTATGNLKNTTGTATGVEIGILNPALAAINIATQANDGAGTGQTTTAGSATLTYYAQYVATAAATSGTVASTVTYSIVYN